MSIKPGVTIGDCAIDDLFAVVEIDVLPLAIVDGNPAIIIGITDECQYKCLVVSKGWYDLSISGEKMAFFVNGESSSDEN